MSGWREIEKALEKALGCRPRHSAPVPRSPGDVPLKWVGHTILVFVVLVFGVLVVTHDDSSGTTGSAYTQPEPTGTPAEDSVAAAQFVESSYGPRFHAFESQVNHARTLADAQYNAETVLQQTPFTGCGETQAVADACYEMQKGLRAMVGARTDAAFNRAFDAYNVGLDALYVLAGVTF